MAALVEKGVRVELFAIWRSRILANWPWPFVDAATLVVGTPTVLAGPHPYAAYAVFLANALKPRVKFLSIVGSYGWGGKTVGNPCRHDPQSQRWRCWTRVLCKGAVENGFPVHYRSWQIPLRRNTQKTGFNKGVQCRTNC
ncbi:MAG: hypothetical protein R2860_08775 [Desulfobacterales bacterium]